MAIYKFYFSTSENNNLEENYTSSTNIKTVDEEFKNKKGNVISITKINILSDPEKINSDEALGYMRS